MTAATGPYRLLACDLDGTVLDDDGKLPPPAAELLREAQAQGVHVVVAIGRRLHSALPLIQPLGLTGYCVVQNGALVARVESAELVRRTLVPARVVAGLIDLLESRDCPPLLYTTAKPGPTEIHLAQDAADPTGFLAWYRGHAAGSYTSWENLREAPRDDIVRLTAYHRRALLEEVEREVQACFDPVRTMITFDPAQKVDRLEVLHREVSKWHGVQFVLDQLGLDAGDVLAIGDDSNDIEMLAAAGGSLAAPGATAGAREAAQRVLQGDSWRAVVDALRQTLGIG